jgi:hypothetical protein
MLNNQAIRGADAFKPASSSNNYAVARRSDATDARSENSVALEL